jgi:hypothetical protein
MSRTFLYRFEDGFEVERPVIETNAEMYALTDEHGACTYNGWQDFMGFGKPGIGLCIIGGANSRGDAFRTGYNPALGMEIKSPAHYKQVLKEKGLREVGNEKQKSAPVKKKSYVDDEIIKQAVDAGASISGQEAAALKEGKSLK